MATSKKDGRLSSKLLRTKSTPKAVKSVSGSDLAQRPRKGSKPKSR